MSPAFPTRNRGEAKVRSNAVTDSQVSKGGNWCQSREAKADVKGSGFDGADGEALGDAVFEDDEDEERREHKDNESGK
jgi:hypothetical protein